MRTIRPFLLSLGVSLALTPALAAQLPTSTGGVHHALVQAPAPLSPHTPAASDAATPTPAQPATDTSARSGAEAAALAASLGADVRRDFAHMAYVRADAVTLDALRAAGAVVREIPHPQQLGLTRGTLDPRSVPLLPRHLPAGETSPAIVALDGPWASDWIDRLEDCGVSFVSSVPPYAALVRGPPEAYPAVADLPFVVALSPFRPEWRMSRRLTDAEPGEQLVKLTGFAGADFARVETLVAELGLLVESVVTSTGSTRVKAVLPTAVLVELASLPEVRAIDIAPAGSFHNEKVRVVMQTERTWNSTPAANLDFYNPVYGIGVHGENQWIVVTDEGILATHEALQQNNPSKVISHYVPSVLDPSCAGFTPAQMLGDPGNHGTHVVGSIAGNEAGLTNFMSPNLYDGLAFRSRVLVQAIGGPTAFFPEFCVPDPYIDPILKAPYDTWLRARTHNSSWGHGPTWGTMASQTAGQYSQISLDLDEFLYERPDAVQVFSAGNFGTLPDWSTYVPGSLSDDAMAKNVISVGATLNGDARHNMYLFSSNGPTDDGVGQGRVKPDLVAPGQDVTSAEIPNNDSYGSTWDGTSFAAPVITGAVALVRSYFAQGLYPNDASDPPMPLLPFTSSALVKAMLVNSTVWVQEAYAYTSCAGTMFPGACYPNYDQGFGRPALDTVLEPAGYRQLKVWEDLTTESSVGSVWSRTLNLKDIWQADCTNLRVTLAWTDPPGSLAAYPKLVNDLDLVVTINPNDPPNAITFTGNHQLWGNGNADALNNVEDVMWTPLNAPNGVTKKVRIEVHGISGTMTALDAQRFAVVLTYGPCFDVTPCFGVGGCYAGPGDTVPGAVPPSGVGGCPGHHYDTGDCGIDCGENPSVDCDPPTPWVPVFEEKPVPIDP